MQRSAKAEQGERKEGGEGPSNSSSPFIIDWRTARQDHFTPLAGPRAEGKGSWASFVNESCNCAICHWKHSGPWQWRDSDDGRRPDGASLPRQREGERGREKATERESERKAGEYGFRPAWLHSGRWEVAPFTCAWERMWMKITQPYFQRKNKLFWKEKKKKTHYRIQSKTITRIHILMTDPAKHRNWMKLKWLKSIRTQGHTANLHIAYNLQF